MLNVFFKATKNKLFLFSDFMVLVLLRLCEKKKRLAFLFGKSYQNEYRNGKESNGKNEKKKNYF